MLDLTKPLQTRDGRKVTLIGCADLSIKYPIAAIIDGCTEISLFMSDGRYYSENDCFKHSDLVNVSEKHTAYLNIYKNDSYHKTKYLANENALDTRIACIRIEYIEGQFDE